MTTDEDFEVVSEAVLRSWHGNGCGTNVGIEDGGGYCTPGCDVYEGKHALSRIARELNTLRDKASTKEDI